MPKSNQNSVPAEKRTIETGDEFTRLTAICKVNSTDQFEWWLLECACGRLTQVRAQHLLSGDTASCGCLPRSRKPRENLVEKISDIPKRVYASWRGYKQKRLLCKAWLDARVFYADVGDPPSPFSLLLRKDTSKKIGPKNFFWGGVFSRRKSKYSKSP